MHQKEGLSLQAIALASWNEQDGDARYLSQDLLEANPSTAADIFSFGIMLFEVKSGVELPGSGEYWDFLRNGAVPPPAGCGSALAGLIHGMMASLPAGRPSAEDILQACCKEAERAAVALILQQSAI